ISQARQAIAQAIVADGMLTVDDVQTIIKCKGEVIAKGGILEFYPLEENTFELGGFAKLKTWLDRARVGFSPEAKAMNLTPPKGVLLVGVQGCGKSLAAKVIASEWKLTMLKLDVGRLSDKYVGVKDEKLRSASALNKSDV